jgi:hypothetical protein
MFDATAQKLMYGFILNMMALPSLIQGALDNNNSSPNSPWIEKGSVQTLGKKQWQSPS